MIPGISSGLGSFAPEMSPVGTGAASTSTGQGFGDVLKTALSNVDHLQSGADTQIGNLVQGAPNTDVGNVMVSVEKADIAFQLMMQVRNKIVSAYQDIEKMQF